MPDATPQPDPSLHLPSLVIKNFRGIDELTIPRLGRVTLLAGKNGVGKTTVLDAVRIWAARGERRVVDAVLEDRGDSLEPITQEPTQDTGSDLVHDRWALFNSRSTALNFVILIGLPNGADTLKIWPSPLATQLRGTGSFPALIRDGDRLESEFGQIMDSPEDSQGFRDPPRPSLLCDMMGPNRPTDARIERYWSEIALTSHEDRAIEALNLMANESVERVALLDSPVLGNRIYRRRFMAKVKDEDLPVPLRTLGDGATRAFAVALALAKSAGGFLLIDEAENGIHHSIQPKFWNMVLQTAKRNNVQVIATTHSWDCVKGFSQAANELEDVEGVLYRIQRNRERLRAVEYPESELAIATESGIEVR